MTVSRSAWGMAGGSAIVVGCLIAGTIEPDVDAPLVLLSVLGTLLAMISGFRMMSESVREVRLMHLAHHHAQMDKMRVIQQSVASRQAVARGGQRLVGGEEGIPDV